MKYTYTPRGVCSRKMIIELEDGVVKSVEVDGGCSGNSQGVCSLVEEMDATEVIDRLDGIRCGFKPTSCPDQLAHALTMILNGELTPDD